MDMAKVICIVLTITLFCVTVILAGLSNIGRLNNIAAKRSLFPNGFKFQTESVLIEPDDKIYATWIFIYIYQAIWIAYAASLTLNSNVSDMVNNTVYAFFASALVCNIAWMFLWTSSMYSLGFVLYMLQAIFLDTCLYFASTSSVQYLQSLSQGCQNSVASHLWKFRLLIINGIAFFAGWVSATGLINLAVVLQMDLDLSPVPASKVSLSLMLVGIVSWATLQRFLCNEYTRFMFAEYIPAIIVLGGTIGKKWNHEHEEIRSFSLAIFVISLMLFVLRLALVIAEEAKRGFFYNEITDNVRLI